MQGLVFLIPILGISCGLFAIVGAMFVRPWLAHKERMGQALNAQTAERAAQYAAQTERLEQRVRVLERIITDRGVDLSHEIESLRDTPLN